MRLFEDGTIDPGVRLVQVVLEYEDDAIVVQLAGRPKDRQFAFCPNYVGLTTIGKELVVWVDQDGIQWDVSNRILSCNDDLNGEQITVQFRVGESISVVCLSRGRRSEGNPAGVFVETVQRFATPVDGIWYYPCLPVVGSALKYVDLGEKVAPEPKHSAGRVSWEIRFRGGVKAVLECQEGKAAFSSVGDDKNTHEIAVWPPKPLGAPWKFYSVYLGKGLKDRKVQFWTRDISSDELRLVSESAGDRILRYGNVCTLVLSRPSKSLFLEVNDEINTEQSRFNSGLFPLIDGPVPIGTNAPTIMLDFGTSNTAGAIGSGCGESLNFGKQTTSDPKVLVGTENKKKDLAYLQTWFPWLPTVPSMVAVGIRNPALPFTEIPTALFKLGVDCNKDGAPFQDFGLGNESAEMQRREGIEWKTGIKWTNDQECHTELFLTTLLIWVAGLYATDISGIKLGATYPLAFDTKRRNDFSGAIVGACRRVAEWTGFPAAPINNGPLAVDEGTALQFLGEQVFAGCSFDEDETSKLVLTADIGGGTFDLSLSVLQNNNFRVLAADSVKFGAELVINTLQERTHPPAGNGDGNAPELRYLISRTVRQGLLDGVMAASQDEGCTENPWEAGTPQELASFLYFPSWIATKSTGAAQVRGRSHLFFYLLAEYASRFVAGTLLDTDALKYRILNAPGSANFRTDSPAYRQLSAQGPVAIAVILGGNGWNFLNPDVASMDFGNWQTLVTNRTKELLDCIHHPWKSDVEWAWPDSLPKGKGATSIGAVRALSPQNGFGANVFCDVEAAPNGFDDLKKPSGSATDGDHPVPQEPPANWWVQVGPGSRFARGTDVLAPFSNHAKHNGELGGPLLSSKNTALLTNASNLLRDNYHVLVGGNTVKEIRKKQSDLSRGLSFRVIPTIRLLWDEHLHKLISNKPIS